MERSGEFLATDLVVDINLSSDGDSLSGPQLLVEDQTISFVRDVNGASVIPSSNLQLAVAPNTTQQSCQLRPIAGPIPATNEMADNTFVNGEIPDNLENCLALNRAYQNSIQENINSLTARLNSVRAEISSHASSEISGAVARRAANDKNADSASVSAAGRRSKRSCNGGWASWYTFLTRYFSGTSGFAPRRRYREAARKLRLCHYADLRWSRPWCQSECDCLQRAVIASARDTRRRQVRAQIATLHEKRHDLGENQQQQHASECPEASTTAQLEELEKKLAEVETIDDLELAGDRLHGEHDWLDVSTIMSSCSAPSFGEFARHPDECERQWRHLVHPSINQGAWSVEEDTVIRRVMAAGGMHTAARARNVWHCMAQQLKGSRTPLQLFQRWVLAVHDDNPMQRSRWQMWSTDETRLLLQTVRRLRVATSVIWSEVAFYLDQRSPEQCRARYFFLNPCVKRGHFTRQEDMALLAGVEVFALGDHYISMAHLLTSRTCNQLRRRYNGHLASGLNRCRWSRAEEELLVRLVWQLGGAWRQIAHMLKTNRAPLDCRHRFVRIFRHYRRNGSVVDDVGSQSSGGGAGRCGKTGAHATKCTSIVAPFSEQSGCVYVKQIRTDALAAARSVIPPGTSIGSGDNLMPVEKRLTLFKQYCVAIGLLSTTPSSVSDSSSTPTVVAAAPRSKPVRTTVNRGQRIQALPPVSMYLGRLMVARAPWCSGRYPTVFDNKLAANTLAMCAAWGMGVYRGYSRTIARALVCDSVCHILEDTDRRILELVSVMSNADSSRADSDCQGRGGSQGELEWPQYPLLPPGRTSLVVLRALLQLRWHLEASLLDPDGSKPNLVMENARRAALAESLNLQLAGEARASISHHSSSSTSFASSSFSGVGRGCDGETVARHRANMSQVDVYFRSEAAVSDVGGEGSGGGGMHSASLRMISLLLLRSHTEHPHRLLAVLRSRVPGLVKIVIGEPSPARLSVPATIATPAQSEGEGERVDQHDDPAWDRLRARFVSLLLWPSLVAFRRQPSSIDSDGHTDNDSASIETAVHQGQSLYNVLIQRSGLSTSAVGGKRKVPNRCPSSSVMKKRALMK